jgi:hypothetical protein
MDPSSEIITNMVRIRRFVTQNGITQNGATIMDLVRREIECIDVELVQLTKLGKRLIELRSHDLVEQNNGLICDYILIKQELYEFYDRLHAKIDA